MLHAARQLPSWLTYNVRAGMMNTEQLIQEIEDQRALMISVSTGGPRIQVKNPEYMERRLRIKAALLERSVDDPNPYGDLWAWYGKWSSGDLPSYQSRREYVSRLYQKLIDRLAIVQLERPAEPIVEDTGWVKVDRGIDGIRVQLEQSKSEEQFQTVGLLCRETLISIAQAVYDPFLHTPSDGIDPSPTDANRMLDGFLSYTMKGSTHEALRRHAKAALALANELVHKRTASFRDAALAAEATRTVVNIVAIVSGKRDPEESVSGGRP
jgi:hypothetical protein